MLTACPHLILISWDGQVKGCIAILNLSLLLLKNSRVYKEVFFLLKLLSQLSDIFIKAFNERSSMIGDQFLLLMLKI